jgi:hypothetical protein
MALAKLLRYTDLKAAGIVGNRVTLARLIKTQQFPPGRLLGQNTRAWTEPEIEHWLDTRPAVRAPDTIPRECRFTAAASKGKAGAVKTKRQRRRRP